MTEENESNQAISLAKEYKKSAKQTFIKKQFFIIP
jgi:hypothetical protein